MKKTIILLSILIIASFLRLYNLTEIPPGLYPDEAMNGNNAIESWGTSPLAGGLKVFYPENFGREGLLINIQGLFVAVFGNEAWVLRLPSALFGILTVLGLYFFTKELFYPNNESGVGNYGNDKNLYSLFFIRNSENIALLSAFLLATSFWHINFSRIGFRAIIAPFFLVWGLYFLLKAKNKCQMLNGKWQALSALAGLTYGFGFYSYIAYRATPLFILFLMPVLYKKADSNIRKNLLRVFGIFILFTFLIGLPLGIYFLENPADFFGRTAGISIFNSDSPIRNLALNTVKTLGMFNFVGDFNWRHNVAGRPLLFWPVGIAFLVGAYFSLRKIFLEKSWISRESIIWSWFLVALLPVIISNEGLPHALRSMLMIPPVFILSAIGGMKIYELLKPKLNNRWLPAVSCLFLSLLIYEAYFTYFVTWGRDPRTKNAFSYNDSVIAEQLNKLPRTVPKYVIVSGANRKIERDYPISLQSILFLSDTFTEEKRKEKNLFYLTKEQFKPIDISVDSFIVSL